MVLKTQGNVGIGTTTPTSILDIADNGGSAFVRLKGTGTDAFAGLHFFGNDSQFKAHIGYGNPNVFNALKDVAYFGPTCNWAQRSRSTVSLLCCPTSLVDRSQIASLHGGS